MLAFKKYGDVNFRHTDQTVLGHFWSIYLMVYVERWNCGRCNLSPSSSSIRLSGGGYPSTLPLFFQDIVVFPFTWYVVLPRSSWFPVSRVRLDVQCPNLDKQAFINSHIFGSVNFVCVSGLNTLLPIHSRQRKLVVITLKHSVNYVLLGTGFNIHQICIFTTHLIHVFHMILRIKNPLFR